MLTRFVRIQLVIFTIAAVIAMTAMVMNYIQAPTLLGIGRMTVKLELPATAGLYRFSNVTYRGVQIGTVIAVGLDSDGVQATLSMDTSPKIPADLKAYVRSVSAIGEQYVDLRPRRDAGPYLHDGSVIAGKDVGLPQPVGPLLDKASALIDSIPKGKLGDLLDETFTGLNGSGYDLGSLFDSAATISGRLNPVAGPTRALVEHAGPLLDSQAQTTDAIRTWARSLAGITGRVATDDPQVRTLLRNAPGALDEASRLLQQFKPTLPVLLANLTTLGQIGVTYHPAMEQLLVLTPPLVAAGQVNLPRNTVNGIVPVDVPVITSDPPPCMVGFLPPQLWRSAADTTTIDTPNGLYCKLPQDSAVGVRGARNYPCMEHPGKRAPTVEICDSDRPYEPLAMRDHVFGPRPLDPNLLSQGIPPDDRINIGDKEYGPTEGTPLPPGVPAAPPPPAAAPGPVPPLPGGTAGDMPSAAPSSYDQHSDGPSIAIAQYNPRTGQYAAPDGQVYRQSDLAHAVAARTWKDLLPS